MVLSPLAGLRAMMSKAHFCVGRANAVLPVRTGADTDTKGSACYRTRRGYDS